MRRELNGLVLELLLPLVWPASFGHEFVQTEQLPTAPDASGAVDGQFVFATKSFTPFFPVQTGDEVALRAVDIHFFQLPCLAFAQAQTRPILQQNRVVLRRGSLRLHVDGHYHEGRLHHFAMLPYGMIRYRGAPAELRDIPIGTVLYGRFYLPPDPETSAVPNVKGTT